MGWILRPSTASNYKIELKTMLTQTEKTDFNEKDWKDSADLTLKPKKLQISMPNFKSYGDLPKTF